MKKFDLSSTALRLSFVFKAEMQISVLFLLNVMLWQPLQWFISTFLFDKWKNSLMTLYRKHFKIKYFGIELLNKNKLICVYFKRGPPIFLLQS